MTQQQAPSLNLVDLQETAFDDLYTRQIEPILRSKEGERQEAVKSFWRRGIALGLLTIAVTYGTWMMTSDPEPVIWVLVLGGFLTAWVAYAPVQAVATATKGQSLGVIADAIGCSYDMGTFDPDGMELFGELSLLPSFDRSTCQDRFAGRHHGCAYAFYDGHLERKVHAKNGTSWHTVFRGQLICIDFPKRFLGTTVVRRDKGLFNFLDRWSTKLQRVGLGDGRLERAFEVYSDDQVEARYLIHPVFMERLLDLETRFKGEKLRCAFYEGKLLIAVEGGDKFEIGSMFSTLLDAQRVRNVINDLAQIMKVIEAVLTAERGVLPE